MNLTWLSYFSAYIKPSDGPVIQLLNLLDTTSLQDKVYQPV